jgi:hypothetical protein
MGNRTPRSQKKRSAKRKAARLLMEQAMRQVKARMRPAKGPRSTETYVRGTVIASPKGDKRAVLQFRRALLGAPAVAPIVLDDVDLVGMTEDPQEFGEFLARVGIVTLAALTGTGLGPETKMGDILGALVKYLEVDLEALKKAAEVDPETPAPVSETEGAPLATEQAPSTERPVL